MDAARWDRIQELFHTVAAMPPAERRARLEVECRDEPTLVDEVLSLLEYDAEGGSLLDRGVAQVAHRMLDGAPDAAPPRESFGPYRLRRLIGEGGMGVVYLAEREDLGSTAALKVLRDAWLSPARRERFLSEQRTLAQLNHPAIARLLDAGSLADGTPWIVMEYVEGAPITEHCRARGATIRERLVLLRAVCEAVQHAHGHAIIHRDLKPSNILVTDDGAVKLLDFGIAKQLDTLERAAEQTRTGLRLMTPAYAAPEQFHGGRIGTYTDIYALGVILYELLTDRLPFDNGGATPTGVGARPAGREAPRPSAVARGPRAAPETGSRARSLGRTAWADLDVLCLTAMHEDPERRYRTVDALLRDIDHYLAGEPLEARPDTLRYTATKFVRRNWRPVAATAAALVLVVGLVAFYTVRLAAARDAAVAESARTQRIQRFMLGLFEGDRAAGPAESLRVVELVDRGVREAANLDAEPAVQAELLETLGGIYRQLGTLDRADSLLTLALERRRARLGAQHPDVAASLVALGELRIDQARLDEAEQLLREAVALDRRVLSAAYPAGSRAPRMLGRALTERGAYDDAVVVLEEAVRLESAGGTPTPELLASMSELANTHFYAGRFATTDSLTRLILPLRRRLHGERHPLVAEDLVNLGAVAFEQGDYAAAERYNREALDIVRGWYGDDHHRTASALTLLGRALAYQKRLPEAEEALRTALSIQERVYGPAHPRVASALNDLGVVALERGELDAAEATYRRMADIYRAVHGEEHYLIGVALSNLASVFQARNDYRGAEQVYRDVVRRFTHAQGADHLNTGIARIKLGRALLRQRRFADAATESAAGYEIVARQSSLTVSFLNAARTDIVAAFDSLGAPERAARFRAERDSLARMDSTAGR